MIKLDRFEPREYQLDFFENMERTGDKYKHAIIVHGRRSGKDVMAFQYAVRHALRKTTTVLYMLKSFSQAKQVIWDMIMTNGIKLIDTMKNLLSVVTRVLLYSLSTVLMIMIIRIFLLLRLWPLIMDVLFS